MDTLTLPARLDSLEALNSFALERAAEAGASAELLHDIRLGLEEILTNIFFYAYPKGEGSVQLSFAVQQDETLCIRITDWGIPFDPTTSDTPDLTQNVSDREIGGLGVYLARQVAHEMVYERTHDANQLTIFFRL